ncbi:MAG: SDR family oxidoreductase [Gammaproteobacteria bacterium]
MGPIERGRFADDLNEINEMLAVSFSGALYGAQAVLPIMKRQGAGHIVNMSSVVGRKAFPHFGGYSIAMHAISAFSDALRQELHGTERVGGAGCPARYPWSQRARGRSYRHLRV